MATVRLYGHAGSDVQGAYLPKALIEADEARDPLLAGAALMAGHGWMTAAEIAEAYEEIGATLARQAEAAIQRPKIITPAHVMQSLTPPKREVARSNTPTDDDRKAMFGSDAGALDKPQHMARLLSWALADLMLAHQEIVVEGEDVGPKGGVYNVTAKLHQRFGSARVDRKSTRLNSSH